MSIPTDEAFRDRTVGRRTDGKKVPQAGGGARLKNASNDPFAQSLHMALLVESWRSEGGMGLSPEGHLKRGATGLKMDMQDGQETDKIQDRRRRKGAGCQLGGRVTSGLTVIDLSGLNPKRIDGEIGRRKRDYDRCRQGLAMGAKSHGEDAVVSKARCTHALVQKG